MFRIRCWKRPRPSPRGKARPCVRLSRKACAPSSRERDPGVRSACV